MPDQPDLAAVGRRIRALYAQGMTDDQVRAQLAKEDAAPPAGAPGQPPPLTRESLAAMSKADQRRAVAERWDEVVAALSGRRRPGQPLSLAELADLAGTLKRSPEVAGDPDRWQEIRDELERRARGGAR